MAVIAGLASPFCCIQPAVLWITGYAGDSWLREIPPRQHLWAEIVGVRLGAVASLRKISTADYHLNLHSPRSDHPRFRGLVLPTTRGFWRRAVLESRVFAGMECRLARCRFSKPHRRHTRK